MPVRKLLAVVGLVALSTNLSAHHGANSQFDLSVEISLTGLVTDLRFVNPHSYVSFDLTGDDGNYVLDDSGQRINVQCEMLSGTSLRRAGWTEEMFSPGTPIKVGGNPSRREENVCVLETMALDRGPEVTRFAQFDETRPVADSARQARTPWGDPNIAGDWAAEARTARPVQDEAYPRVEPIRLTEAGQAAADEVLARIAAGEIADPRINCQPRDFISDWTFNWMPNRIVQEQNRIELTYGFMDRKRNIHLDADEHPADLSLDLSGHSIGRWQNDVLIVNTLGFEPGFRSVQNAITQINSDQYHVIERFWLDNERGTLTRDYEATDTLYWTPESVRSGTDVLYISNLPWEPYNCNDLTVE